MSRCRSSCGLAGNRSGLRYIHSFSVLTRARYYFPRGPALQELVSADADDWARWPFSVQVCPSSSTAGFSGARRCIAASLFSTPAFALNWALP